MESKEIAAKESPLPQVSSVERALVQGDLSKLSAEERLSLYKKTCESLGLNYLTKPFEYISLNGKLTLYAKKDATDQLRSINRVSIHIVSRERIGDIYIVTARAKTPDGREDESTGAVAVGRAQGDALANLLMKSETKAKRRATLSICGLGWLDETEIESIPQAHVVTAEEMHEVAQLPPPETAEEAEAQDEHQLVTEKQLKRLFAITKAHGWEYEEVRQWMIEKLGRESSRDLNWIEYNRLCQHLQTRPKAQPEAN
jgi:hypothetical protein